MRCHYFSGTFTVSVFLTDDIAKTCSRKTIETALKISFGDGKSIIQFDEANILKTSWTFYNSLNTQLIHY